MRPYGTSETAAFGAELSWRGEVLREKGDISNLVALPVGVNRLGGYGEVKFRWKGDVDGRELEFVVCGYMNAATGGPPVLPVRRRIVGSRDASPPVHEVLQVPL